MPRQTPDQLRAEIVDRAALLFARQGFRNTALQQIADAVQYSKAGLLHHFPSKEAIFRAALATTREHVSALAEVALDLPAGAARDRAVVAAAVDFAYEWPGIAALSNSLSEQDDQDDPDLLAASESLGTALGLAGDFDADRLVRVLVMASGLTAAAAAAVRTDMKREWRGAIVEASMNALGYPAEQQRPD